VVGAWFRARVSASLLTLPNKGSRSQFFAFALPVPPPQSIRERMDEYSQRLDALTARILTDRPLLGFQLASPAYNKHSSPYQMRGENFPSSRVRACSRNTSVLCMSQYLCDKLAFARTRPVIHKRVPLVNAYGTISKSRS
jgi:hypothetical protein